MRLVVGWLKAGIPSYVHCRAGWQRSAAVAAGAVAVYDGHRHRRGRRPTSRSASPPPTRCRIRGMTSAPGGTRAAICILRADARWVSIRFGVGVGRTGGSVRRAARRWLARSRSGGASPSAARADLPPVPSRPRRCLGPAPRGVPAVLAEAWATLGSSAAARAAGAWAWRAGGCMPVAAALGKCRGDARPTTLARGGDGLPATQPRRHLTHHCRSTPPRRYSAARRRRAGRCGCSVRSGPRSSCRAAFWTVRAVTVTGSSSGSSDPSETAPWSAKRRALGSTRDS